MEQHHAARRRRHRHGVAQVDGARRHFKAVAHAQVLDVVAVAAWEDAHRAVAVVNVVDGDGGAHGGLRIAVDFVVGPVVVDRKTVVVRRQAEEIHPRQLANRLLVVELLLQQHRLVVHERRQRAEQAAIPCEAGQIQAEIDDRLDLPHHDAAVALAADVEPPAVPLVGQRRVEHEFEDEVRIAAHGRHFAGGEDLRQHDVAVLCKRRRGSAFALIWRRVGGFKRGRKLPHAPPAQGSCTHGGHHSASAARTPLGTERTRHWHPVGVGRRAWAKVEREWNLRH